MTLKRLGEDSVLFQFFRSLATVQVLEFDGTITDDVQGVLSVTDVSPRLKVIRVAISRDDCKRSLQLLAAVSKLRMEEGDPLTTIERHVLESEDGLEMSHEGIQNFLSK